MHGDEFDVVVRHSKWLAFLGDWAYDFAIFVNTHFNAVRRRLGFPYWSFSAWAKLKVKNAVNFIGAFERELAEEARRRGADGVICGHIHHPTIRDVDGITYVNTGDFVESCSYRRRARRRPPGSVTLADALATASPSVGDGGGAELVEVDEAA